MNAITLKRYKSIPSLLFLILNALNALFVNSFFINILIPVYFISLILIFNKFYYILVTHLYEKNIYNSEMLYLICVNSQ